MTKKVLPERPATPQAAPVPGSGTPAGGPAASTPVARPSADKPPASRLKGTHPAPDRRGDILRSAFAVFAEAGFTAARLDDIARRAGVAKGTIYLYFADKETLFVELLREAAAPVLAGIEAIAARDDLPPTVLVERVHALFLNEVLKTERKHLLRLLLQEGARFPEVAQFYHRDIVSKGMALIARLGTKGPLAKTPAGDAVAQFPQLIMAPLLLCIVWDALFERFEHLDMEGLLHAHRKLMETHADATDNQDRAGRTRRANGLPEDLS